MDNFDDVNNTEPNNVENNDNYADTNVNTLESQADTNVNTAADSNDNKAGRFTENNTPSGYRYDTNNNNDSLRKSTYYTENYTKPNSKRNRGIVQLIVVALVSSILGGTIVGGFLTFAAPIVQAPFKNYFDGLLGTNSTAQKVGDIYKKVEIEKSESPVTAIAEKVSPSIVGIRVTFKSQDFFLGTKQGQGEGSGIILRSDGYIMTNNHVIADAVNSNSGTLSSTAKIEVILPSQKDKPYIAQVVGRDERTDLAVLKIEATGLPAAELGDSSILKVGDMAVAIGNPGGVEFMGSVTVGVISGLNRTISAEDNSEIKLLQTDAAINPGNSGGALVNSQGQVIGINSVKIVAQGFEGLGFAIPINDAKRITDSLINYKYVKGRPKLGIVIDNRFNADIAKQNSVPEGCLVSDVEPLSGAYKAGIQVNDIITKIDGKVVTSFNELNDIKNAHKPGETIALEIYRSGATKKVQVTLGEDKGN